MYKSITPEDYRQAEIQKMFFRELGRMDRSALHSILKSKEGRWFLIRLLDATGITANSFTGNSTTFYNEGKRQIGLEILARIQDLGIDAVKLKQKAELEYIENQLRARELAVENFDNQEGSKE